MRWWVYSMWWWCWCWRQSACGEDTAERDHGVRYADRCEVCKVLAIELQSRLGETGRTSEVLHIGYDPQDPKKLTEYKHSELRLIESLDRVCDRVLEYNLHKEREDSTRFAKGMSQTFKTLHGLVDKGVNVNLGIPYELWDKPSVEVSAMKTQCEALVEEYEDDIENWYWKHQDEVSLMEYLCADRVLDEKQAKCLNENLRGELGEKTEL